MPSIHKPQRTFLLKINYYTLVFFFFLLLHSLTSSSHPVDFSGSVRHSFTLWKNSFSTDVMIFGQDACMLVWMKVIFHKDLLHWANVILVEWVHTWHFQNYLYYTEEWKSWFFKDEKTPILSPSANTQLGGEREQRLVSLGSFGCVLFWATRANPLMCYIWVVETFF